MLEKADHFGRVVYFDNWAQVRSIRRFHKHLGQLGHANSMEEAARSWIVRYARLWRSHQDHRRHRDDARM